MKSIRTGGLCIVRAECTRTHSDSTQSARSAHGPVGHCKLLGTIETQLENQKESDTVEAKRCEEEEEHRREEERQRLKEEEQSKQQAQLDAA